MSRFIDLTGIRFGNLVAVSFQGHDKHGQAVWLCRCDCGNLKEVLSGNLKSGGTSSCGCMKAIKCGEKSATHKKTNTRLFNIWHCMKTRCYNPHHKSYKGYGGRGIIICEDWLKDFQTFYDWAMSHGYSEDLTIDRINVNGNYCPENCRWATMKEQNNNSRNNLRYEINGEIKTLAEWCEIYGKKKATVAYRLRHGWTIEEALDLVPRKK